MQTITVKQQKEIHKLMVEIRKKIKCYCSVTYDSNYHEIEPNQNLKFYNEITGHEYFKSPDELITRLKEVINANTN